jgi:hypothetical protein
VLLALALVVAQFMPASSFVGIPQVIAQQAGGAILTLLNPPVEVAVAGGAFAAGRSGQALQPGDAVRTGDGGVALITFLDGSETQLTPSTELTVTAATAGGVSLTQVAGTTVNRVQQLTGGASFSTDTPTAAAIVRGTRYVVTVKTLPVSQRIAFPRLLAGKPDLLIADAVYVEDGSLWDVRSWQNQDSGEVYDTFDRLGEAYPEVGVTLYEDEAGNLWRTRTFLDPETGETFDTFEEFGQGVETLPMPDQTDQTAARRTAAPLAQAQSASITTGVVVEGLLGLVPKQAGQPGVDVAPGQAGAVTNGVSAQSALTPQGLALFDQSTQDLRNVQAALTTAGLADQVVTEFATTAGLVPPAPPPGGPPPGGPPPPPGGGAGGLLGAVSVVSAPAGAGVPTSTPTAGPTPTTPGPSPTPTPPAVPASTPTPTAPAPTAGGSCVANNPAAVSWIGGTGAWDDPTHWSGGSVPGASSDVCIVDSPSAPVVVTIRQGSNTILSLHNQATLALDSGSLTINSTGQSELGNLNFRSGSLSAAGTLVVTNGHALTWLFGTMSGAGTTRIESGATLIMSGLNDRILTNRTLVNAGLITWVDGGRLVVHGPTQGNAPSQIVNEADGVILFQADGEIINSSGSPSMQNFGHIAKLAGTGAALLGVPLTNAPGADITATAGHFNFGPLTNSGMLIPTAVQSAATSNVFGSFTQTASGELTLKLASATGSSGACTTSDQLRITSPSGNTPAVATLAGTLDVVPLGCTPSGPITLLTFSSHTGEFDPALTNLPPGYVAQYSTGNLIIRVP